MGQCYSVYFRYKTSQGSEIVKAIANHYNQPAYINDSLGELMDHFFTQMPVSVEDGWKEVKSSFDASYSWACTMEEVVDVMAPYLENGSNFYCEPDCGSFECNIVDGKAEWEYKEFTEEQELENEISENVTDKYLDVVESYMSDKKAELVNEGECGTSIRYRRYKLASGEIVDIYYDIVDFMVYDFDIDYLDMSRINPVDRLMIENIKQNKNMSIFLEKDNVELTIKGDSTFAHDIALAYQSLVLRRNTAEQ